jgi:hypothetical protein
VGLETARERAQGGGENTASSAADNEPSGSDGGGDGEEADSAESSSSDEQGDGLGADSEVTEPTEVVDGGSSAEERGEGAAEQELAVDEPDAVEADDNPPVRDDGWMRGILNLADFGGAGDDGPAVVVSTGSISSLSIRGMGDAPAPGSLHASISADADPVVRARLLFEDNAQAGEFVDAWPGILEANATSIRLSGLSRPLSEAEWSVDHNEAIVEFTVPERILRRISVTVSRIMDSR